MQTGNAILNVCCIHFNRDNCKCDCLPKILGIWKRFCVQRDNPFEPCHLQVEYTDSLPKPFRFKCFTERGDEQKFD